MSWTDLNPARAPNFQFVQLAQDHPFALSARFELGRNCCKVGSTADGRGDSLFLRSRCQSSLMGCVAKHKVFLWPRNSLRHVCMRMRREYFSSRRLQLLPTHHAARLHGQSSYFNVTHTASARVGAGISYAERRSGTCEGSTTRNPLPGRFALGTATLSTRRRSTS